MKKFELFIAIMFLSMGATATFNFNKKQEKNTAINFIEINLNFGEPEIIKIGEKNIINFKDCSQIAVENMPILPVYRKTFLFPPATRINLQVNPSLIKQIDASTSFAPALAPPGKILSQKEKDKNVRFPEKWYEYEMLGGIVDGQRATILILNIYPAIYDNGKIFYSEKFDLKIEYRPPEKNQIVSIYDFLIISPDDWLNELEALKQHKESKGIKTIVVGLNEIYSGKYFSSYGRDDAEKVKYFIKNAIEEWGIKYVLLVGGRKYSLGEEWLMPVRYANIFWADENAYTSDLYFADIYDGNYNFSSWDTDNNGIYAEWKKSGFLKDQMDLYPDIYLGRLPCRSKFELKIMIDKIISYENRATSKKAVLVAGDNFEQEGYEGEIVTDKTASYLPSYEIKKVYASMMDVNPENIKNALGNGATFMHFHGHGSPISWSTHKPENFDKWEKGLDVLDLPFFTNKEYPIVVIGGCHTAMFNISMTDFPWTSGFPSPADLTSWFIKKINGGAIAGMGYTCFPVATPGEEGDLDGDGINEDDSVESGYGYMELNVFKAYSEGKSLLGETWHYAVSKYVEKFKLPYQPWHLHTIHGFVLLGDPTLKIGGYT
ncbi:MAG: C25 family cysteine peptidase [Candidatus Thermoplasmatota archaeon]